MKNALIELANVSRNTCLLCYGEVIRATCGVSIRGSVLVPRILKVLKYLLTSKRNS